MLVSPRCCSSHLQASLVDGHLVGVGELADQLHLLGPEDFPVLVAELAVIIAPDDGVGLDHVLQHAAVVVHAGDHAGLVAVRHFAELAARMLLEQVEHRLHGLGAVLDDRLEPFLAPPDRRPERHAPGLDLPFGLQLLQRRPQVVAKLWQLDVVGHVQIDGNRSAGA